ncbi:MAG TPA: DUF4012 domain-containing protein [Patescibacteria group bacterium]|nr:DUF4012 domain-containing protein [Patescibacteria group bacterium]
MFRHLAYLRILRWLALFLILIVVLASVGGYFWLRQTDLTKLFNSPLVQEQIKKKLGEEQGDWVALLPRLLGFTKPLTYLVLLENNTELRPGGGFIGTYAVVRADSGKISVLAVDGSENLDREAPVDWKPKAPAVLEEHLDVDRWYFRDANWSPDFAESAKKVLELYQGENGPAAADIEVVIALTPTVIEELMQFTGPIVVEGLEFTKENLVEKLEYEVEYAYVDKGKHFTQRKDIIEPLMLALMNRLKINAWSSWEQYGKLFVRLAAEGQIVGYAREADLQAQLEKNGWAGRLQNSTGDYLCWIDANLAALKTDQAIKRVLDYSLVPQADGRWLAKAEMTYIHNGKFDWRTTRYRTYARIFVPAGSELVAAEGMLAWDRTTKKGEVDKGEELGKTWFGAFTSVEPGKVGRLSFTYLLPPSFSSSSEVYTLFVQKQLGVRQTGLTLNLDFGKNIKRASPAEAEANWHDGRYELFTGLETNQEFLVEF